MSNSNDEYDSDESLSTEEIGDTSVGALEEIKEDSEDKNLEGAADDKPVKQRRKKAPISEEKREMEIQAREELKAMKAQKKKDERLTRKQERAASKLADKVVLQQKERVIYMVQGEDGGFLELDPAEFTKAQIKAVNQEKKNLKTELALGQKLPRLLNGKVKVPKGRTEKQKAQTARLVAANKVKAEQRRLNKAAESDLSIQDSVTKAVKEVLTKPKRELEEIPKRSADPPLEAPLKFF